VVVAVLDAARFTRWRGCLLVGTTAGSIGFLVWGVTWMTCRQKVLHERASAAFLGALEHCGRRWIGRIRRLAQGPAAGPVDTDGGHASPWTTALFERRTGVAVMLISWLTTILALSEVAYAFTGMAPARPAEKGSSPVSSTSTTTTTLAARRTPAGPSTVPLSASSTSTTAPPGGALQCNYRVGEGAEGAHAVLTAMAEVLPTLRRSFLICPTAPMSWMAGSGVFEQPVFTYDGEGAALVAWDSGGRWIVTLVTSDDAASYRSLSPTLDWTYLGKPIPFILCDGLWVQPLVGPDQRITGVGVRDEQDLEGRADRPFFVWGSTVEALLRRPEMAVRLPAGMPAQDTIGPVQYFVDGEIVRSPQTPAEALTLAALMRHCSP
jgi:hypothetical protein